MVRGTCLENLDHRTKHLTLHRSSLAELHNLAQHNSPYNRTKKVLGRHMASFWDAITIDRFIRGSTKAAFPGTILPHLTWAFVSEKNLFASALP
jgi:hypothetical protein